MTAPGYSRWFRAVEWISIIAFFSLSAGICARMVSQAPTHPYLLALALLSGWVSSDFVSGFVHWAGDTWGTVDWPVLGNALIRPFREHHVDPLEMTRHDLVEATGSHCMISVPVLAGCAWMARKEGTPTDLYVITWLTSMTFMVFATASIHKWAHQKKNPTWIVLLQKVGLVLSPKHHAIHHQPPFSKYYSITTGWLNPLLTVTRFYRHLETFITLLTGAVPREDDLGLPKKEETKEHTAQTS